MHAVASLHASASHAKTKVLWRLGSQLDELRTALKHETNRNAEPAARAALVAYLDASARAFERFTISTWMMRSNQLR